MNDLEIQSDEEVKNMFSVKKVGIVLLCISSAVSFAACSKTDEKQSLLADEESGYVVLQMEMDENYSDSDPFENGRLFCVSEDVANVDAEVFYNMNGESGTVEIKERNHDEILWTHTWEADVNDTVFPISISSLQKGKEYVVRFTGTKIKHAIVKVTFDSDVIQEKDRPSK